MFLPFVGAFVLALIFITSTVFWGNLNTKVEIKMEPQTQINQVSVLPENSVEIRKEIDFGEMKDKVEEIINQHESEIGVSFKDLVTNETWGINEDKVFTAASTMKVLAVSALYDAVERDVVSLDKSVGGITLREHARLALEVSDNNSWETINNTVGYKNLQNYALGLGLIDVDVFDNSITAVNFRVLLEKLYRGQLLNNTNTKEVLSFMDRTETENRIPAGIGGAEVIYHKTGTLDALTHDGAIVNSGNGEYILAVYTEFLDGDVDERSAVIAEISEVVWGEYNLQMQN